MTTQRLIHLNSSRRHSTVDGIIHRYMKLSTAYLTLLTKSLESLECQADEDVSIFSMSLGLFPTSFHTENWFNLFEDD